jgi:hypothetical protein
VQQAYQHKALIVTYKALNYDGDGDDLQTQLTPLTPCF